MLIKSLAAAAAILFGGSALAATGNLAYQKATTASSFYDQGTETFSSANAVDGITTDTGAPANWSFWLAQQGENAGAWVQVDLGAQYDISSITLFDTHNRGYNDRGTQAFTISTSADGDVFQTVGSGAFTLAEWQNQTAKSLELIATGRFVRFTVDSVYGGESAGLAEIQVFGTAATAAVPEPANAALLLASLGVLGTVARRRGSRQA